MMAWIVPYKSQDSTVATVISSELKEIHITGQVPRQLDPQNGPALNISAIAREVLERLKNITVSA